MTLNLKIIYKLLLLLAGVTVWAMAWTDLDWMIVCYKFQFGQGLAAAEVWEFCPFIKVNWWVAYAATFWRITLGAGLVGYVVGHLSRNDK